ncbi:hypothetical protein ACUOJY_26815, partial [Escherichia coli]
QQEVILIAIRLGITWAISVVGSWVLRAKKVCDLWFCPYSMRNLGVKTITISFNYFYFLGMSGGSHDY